MREKLKQQYDSLFGSENSLYRSNKAIKLVRSLSKYLASGKVLDIGGGEGRNALYLAKQGYEVSVVDLSSVGIENLRQAAQQAGVKISTKVADVTEGEIEENFDGVLMSFVLHHMNKETVERLIKNVQQHTNENGVHIIATFANRGGLFERNEFKQRFYPSIDELKGLYEGWEILHSSAKESFTKAKNKKGELLKNDIICFVARKLD